MTGAWNSGLRQWWPLWTLAIVVIVGLRLVAVRLQAQVATRLPQFLHDQVERALGRSVRYGRIGFSASGAWVENLRLPRKPGEQVDPLVAGRLTVTADWAHWLRTGRTEVREVTLEGVVARLALQPPQKPARPWTEPLLKLGSLGVRRVRVRDASVWVRLPASRTWNWKAEGAAGSLDLAPATFAYHLTAGSLVNPLVRFRNLSAGGTGDAARVRLVSAGADYGLGRLSGSGDLRVGDTSAMVHLVVTRLPLTEIAAQMGIPRGWAVRGDVTGALDLAAPSGQLRRVHGTLRVSRGELTTDRGRLPWERGSALVDWNPDRARVSSLEVSGRGLALAGEGSLDTSGGTGVFGGAFRLTGVLLATDTAAVARLASVIGLREALDARWQASRVRARFAAAGAVSRLARATAHGRVEVTDLRFRPVADQEVVSIDRVAADVERAPGRLELRNILSNTEGFHLSGGVSLPDAPPGRGATFRAAGRIEVRDLPSFRRVFPMAALWKVIPAAAPRASGELTFRAFGPIDDPPAIRATGVFEARRFRFTAPSPLPNATVFFIPVQVARGKFRQGDRRFTLYDLALETADYALTGDASFNLRLPMALTTHVRVETDDWRSLPAMPASALPELRGGHFTGRAYLTSPLSALAGAPVDGSFQLKNASYQPWEATAPPVPVDEFGARFRWAERVLSLPALTLKTPVGDANSEGRIYPQGDAYHLALDLRARSQDPGGLLARFNADLHLAGGSASARLQLDAPIESLDGATVFGTVDLTGGTLQHAVTPLGLSEVPVDTLSLDFSRNAMEWHFARIALESPMLTANLGGQLSPTGVDADVLLEIPRWAPPNDIPLTGGTVTLRGHLMGDPLKPTSLAFDGQAKLAGARARLARDGLGAEGGALTVEGRVAGSLGAPAEWTVDGRAVAERVRVSVDTDAVTLAPVEVSVEAAGAGPIGDPLTWLLSARLEAAGLDITLGEHEIPEVQRISIAMARDGDALRWKDAELRLADASLRSSGEWSPAGHEIEVSLRVGDLSALGLALPEGNGASDYVLTATLRGDSKKPLASAVGRLDANGFRLKLGDQPPELFERLGAAFTYDQDGLRVEGISAEGTLGTLRATGTLTNEGHTLTLALRGDDFGKTHVRLPEGFAIQGFEADVEIKGTRAAPARDVSGTAYLRGARFPFGPEGPHALTEVRGRFHWAGERAVFSDVIASGPAGEFRGGGEAGLKGYRLDLNAERVDPKVARWLAPGEVQGGRLSGTLALAGNPEVGPTSAVGGFELRAAAYVPPAALGTTDIPMPITRLAGRYHWSPGRSEVTDLVVESPLLSASGVVTIVDEQGEAQAEVKTEDLGAVADHWEMLAGWLRGGSGEAAVQARFHAAETRGTLRLTARGGRLILPGGTGDFAEHPVERLTTTMAFEPGKLTFSDTRLRGPKVNGDVQGYWAETGPIRLTGKAWLTRAFTQRLLPRGLLGFFARLFVKDVQTDFTLSGTADRVMLSASITRSATWRFARGSVPKEFQAIAEGKAPLWVRPAEPPP